ncbi:Hpt domain-containing protein [Lacimicrobium alkaliphilum]|uniref:HPt domain-containing protein n=1 Tax=Lacimicrobium alkaliphilum TaxID=1526571 RepID=A0ABQ1R902_9ALTE|nr:Hpt domain-containing protein [Lacimicrobium alkaliphilum]GGD58180.1 hypothetical protein GCM10011357_11930 [Lacimicrobium alkaliphilum]
MSIDPNKITEYVGDISDAERSEMLTNFKQSLKDRQSELQAAIKSQNWPACAQLTHNLKSNALYFGADKLHEVSQAGEKLFLSATLETNDLHAWLEKFNQQCQLVLSSIDSVLKDERHDQKP